MTSSERVFSVQHCAPRERKKILIHAIQVKQWIKNLVVPLVGLAMLDMGMERQMKA
jgi:hypothetical protein